MIMMETVLAFFMIIINIIYYSYASSVQLKNS